LKKAFAVHFEKKTPDKKESLSCVFIGRTTKFAATFEKNQYCRAPKLRTHDKEHCTGPNNTAAHVTPQPNPNIKRRRRSGPLISRSDG
jgi:hypothetical protein